MEIGPHKYYALERIQSRKVGEPPPFLFHRCSFANAARHLRNGYMHCTPYICTTENPSFCSPGRIVFVIDSKCLLDAGFVIYPYIWSEREPHEAEWRISPPNTELVFFSGGPYDPHAHATQKDTLPLACVLGIGVANKSVVQSWDEEKMREVEELAAQRGYAIFDFSWEEWWDDGPLNEDKAMVIRRNPPAVLYHVTTDKNARKIAKKGIIPLQPSNWVQAGSRERYGKGEIFAFDHQLDAMRWGCRMDWELNKKMGSGKVVIVSFVDDAEWEIDDADPLSQAGRKGNWLKRFGSVKPEQITLITPVTIEHVKRVVASNPAPSRFWGRAGAGILFFCPEDQTYLLTIRSQEVEQPGTVGIPGGACKGEGFYSEEEGRQVGQAEAWVCATREATEELGWFPHEKKIFIEVLFEKGNFTYRTFIVEVPLAEKAISQKTIEVNWENDDARWYGVGAIWKAWPILHFGAQHVFHEIYGMDANTPPSGV